MVNFFSENMIPFAICYMATEAISKEVNSGRSDWNIFIDVLSTIFLACVVCILDYILLREIYGIYIFANMFISTMMDGVNNGIENAWQNSTYEMFSFLLFVEILLCIAIGTIWERRYKKFTQDDESV